MIEITYTQHCGNNPGQQDALWNGVSLYQQRDLPIGGHITDVCKRLFVGVADGVATSAMPQKASRFVLEAIAAEIAKGAAFDRRMIRRVHGRLCDALAKGKTFGSSTTLAAVECWNGHCKVLSVGDSRVYRIAASGDWTQLSRDHSLLNAMIDRGEADAETEYASCYNMLDACLVADDMETEFPIHSAEASLQPGDSLLLCTDGIHDTLGDNKLRQLTSPDLVPSVQVEQWRKAVLAAGAPDNFSMVLLRVEYQQFPKAL